MEEAARAGFHGLRPIPIELGLVNGASHLGAEDVVVGIFLFFRALQTHHTCTYDEVALSSWESLGRRVNTSALVLAQRGGFAAGSVLSAFAIASAEAHFSK